MRDEAVEVVEVVVERPETPNNWTNHLPVAVLNVCVFVCQQSISCMVELYYV